MASRRRSREQWRKLVFELEGSGLSPRAFAATRKELNAGTLSWWRTRLRREARQRDGQAPSSAGFLPVVIDPLSTPSESVQERHPIEVVLANGVRLRFEQSLDRDGLVRLATAFGGGS